MIQMLFLVLTTILHGIMCMIRDISRQVHLENYLILLRSFRSCTSFDIVTTVTRIPFTREYRDLFRLCDVSSRCNVSYEWSERRVHPVVPVFFSSECVVHGA